MVYKSSGRGYAYFRCRKSANGACEQRKKMIRIDSLERLVTEQLTKDFKKWLLKTKPKKNHGKLETIEQLHKSLDRISVKLNHIKKSLYRRH